MHATDDHSDITFPLKFLLILFLSEALLISNEAQSHITQKPVVQSAVAATSQCIHEHCS